MKMTNKKGVRRVADNNNRDKLLFTSELENTVREKLFLLRDADYLQVSGALIPGAQEMIGVRLPRFGIWQKKSQKETGRPFFMNAPATTSKRRC